jgi:hypothetical protein
MQPVIARYRGRSLVSAAQKGTVQLHFVVRPAVAFIALVYVAVFVGHISASGLRETPVQTESVVIEGTIRRVGSEPFTRLVVTAGDGPAGDGTAGEVTDYIIPDAAKGVFEPHVGTVVIVESRVERRERTTVDGEYTIVEHVLVEPVIVSSE